MGTTGVRILCIAGRKHQGYDDPLLHRHVMHSMALCVWPWVGKSHDMDMGGNLNGLRHSYKGQRMGALD